MQLFGLTAAALDPPLAWPLYRQRGLYVPTQILICSLGMVSSRPCLMPFFCVIPWSASGERQNEPHGQPAAEGRVVPAGKMSVLAGDDLAPLEVGRTRRAPPYPLCANSSSWWQPLAAEMM
jgi:hypothetical protein